MLGLMHRSVLGCGLGHFRDMFQPAPPSVSQKHSKQLCSHLGPRHLQMVARSALGLVDVYNLLPKHVVEQKSVPSHAARIADAPEVSGVEHPLHLFS